MPLVGATVPEVGNTNLHSEHFVDLGLLTRLARRAQLPEEPHLLILNPRLVELRLRRDEQEVHQPGLVLRQERPSGRGFVLAGSYTHRGHIPQDQLRGRHRALDVQVRVTRVRVDLVHPPKVEVPEHVQVILLNGLGGADVCVGVDCHVLSAVNCDPPPRSSHQGHARKHRQKTRCRSRRRRYAPPAPPPGPRAPLLLPPKVSPGEPAP